MSRHPPCDGVDGVFHVHTLFLELVAHLAQRVLGLRHRHAVTGDDDDAFSLFEHIGRVFRAALFIGPLFARAACPARFGRCAEPARDH